MGTSNESIGRDTSIKSAPVMDTKEASSTSSKVHLDYSRFDKMIAALDQEVCYPHKKP